MFEWSEELKMVRDAVRTFVDTEIRPHREELEHGDLPPYDLLRKLYKTFGMDQMAADSFDKRIAAEENPAPAEKSEREGGGGGGFTMLPIIELCKCSPGMVTAMGVSVGLTAAAIMSKGTIAQKKRWARDIVTMDKIGAWAITEPGSGSDAFGSMAATARRDGDEYVLNGSKNWVTNGLRAGIYLIFARTDKAAGSRGISAFIVEKGTPGFKVAQKLRKMGFRGSQTAELVFDDCRVPVRNLVGDENAGVKVVMSGLDLERAMIAPLCLGIAERALELSLDYARTRQQFGQPIASFQMIQDKLAQMYVWVESMRLFTYQALRAASALEHGEIGRGEIHQLTAASVMFAANTMNSVLDQAVQIHGGSGYIWESEINRLYRSIKLLEIGAGTTEVRKLIISGEMLRG